MKTSSQVKNMKKNLIINIEPINYKPNPKILEDKWKFVLNSVNEILVKGDANICYQELYQIIDDLLLFEKSNNNSENIKNFEALFINHANNCYQELNTIHTSYSGEDFLNQFNSFWRKISLNFVLLRKILVKLEKRIYSQNYNQSTVWSFCKLFDF
jgi:hypothetical protein